MTRKRKLIKKVLSKFQRRLGRDSSDRTVTSPSTSASVIADAAPTVTEDPAKHPAKASLEITTAAALPVGPGADAEASSDDDGDFDMGMDGPADGKLEQKRDSVVLEHTEAGDHAIRIPEILTQILSFVPPVLLLTRFRLVCKSWKQEIEYGPLLKWITWVPVRGCIVRRLKNHSSSVDITLPPPSIRYAYTNKNCTCPSGRAFLHNSLGYSLPEGISGGDLNKPGCDLHCYTDLFTIHPIALHFLGLFWKRFMRVPVATHERIIKNGSRDDLMDQLVCLLKPKLRQFENATQEEPAPGIRISTSNRLVRPETLAATITLFTGIKHEGLIETKMYDNGTTAPLHCDYSRSSSRKMLAVKDLVYNVMHRSFFGDEDIIDVKRRRTQKVERKEMPPRKAKQQRPSTAESAASGSIEDLPDYYSVIIQISGKEDKTVSNGKRGGIEDTEIEITLALSEPFDIVDVRTRKLSDSTTNAHERSIPRYGHWDDSASSDMLKKKEWRKWSRAVKPKDGDALPSYADLLLELIALDDGNEQDAEMKDSTTEDVLVEERE